MADSYRTRILQNLISILGTLPWVKTVSHDRIRLVSSDFNEYEVPLIQVFGTRWGNKHANNILEVRWSVMVELADKTTKDGTVDQYDLYNKVEEIENIIGENIQLNVAGLHAFTFTGGEVDLHQIEPYYIAQLEFDAIFDRNLTC